MPSTSNAAHTAAIRRSSASGSATEPTRACASAIRAAVSRSADAQAAAKPGGSSSKASRRRTTSARVADVPRRPHLDGEAEPVQELRPQLALLRVHRADQQEPGGVRHRHPVALDVRAAHRGGVEEGVDEVVVQQVDLVDVEHAAMGRGEQTGLVGTHALGQRALEVERADEPVLGRPDRQLDEPRRAVEPRRLAGAARRGSPGPARRGRS